jgi:methionyl-tRNA formyltransferase
MNDPLNIILLAYPDNPVGALFIRTFLNANLPIQGIIIEQKTNDKNLQRFIRKVRKDGLEATIRRILEMAALRLKRNRIVDVAGKHAIPVYHFEDMNSPACADLLEVLQPDLLVIVSAPILKPWIFTKAKLGCLNPHPGWLPKYRGLGANAYTVLNNEEPGVTIHYIDDGIDTGKILKRERVPVQKDDTIAKINDRAMSKGAELMVKVIQDIQAEQLQIPEIEESPGMLYRAMPYREARQINQRLRMK